MKELIIFPMIRKYTNEDINFVMDIWLNANISAHSFIPRKYWQDNYDSVKTAIDQAEVYVYEDDFTGTIDGFIGLSGNYIEGIFVSERARCHGVGKQLLDYVKKTRPSLELHV